MVEHIGEHLRIGCNVAIPRRKNGKNLLSFSVRWRRTLLFPFSRLVLAVPCSRIPVLSLANIVESDYLGTGWWERGKE